MISWYGLGWTITHYVTEIFFELTAILQTQPPKYLDYSNELSCPMLRFFEYFRQYTKIPPYRLSFHFNLFTHKFYVLQMYLLCYSCFAVTSMKLHVMKI